MSEERGFEIIDKRGGNSESKAENEPAPEPATAAQAQTGAGPGGSAPPPETDQPGEGPEADDDAEGPLPDMDAMGVVSLCVNMLHEVAWVKLGLIPSPITQKIERDLTQARLAIDCAADLARHLDPHVDATTRRDLQNLISTLRMNFVQQSQR
jgi:hypothetical protein